MTTYIVAGATVALTATAVSSGSSIAPSAANSGVGGANGPVYLKVVNTGTVPVFFKTDTTAPTAVTAVDDCIAAGDTTFIQVGVPRQAPATVFFAVVAAVSTAVYVTPVTIVG